MSQTKADSPAGGQIFLAPGFCWWGLFSSRQNYYSEKFFSIPEFSPLFMEGRSVMVAHRGTQAIGIVVAIALLVVITGCGGSSETKFKVTAVKGNVTKGGQPYPDAQVSLIFQGQPPKDFPGAGGKTDAQGNYEVMTGTQKGVPAGTYTVVVSKIVGADGKPLVNDPTNTTGDAGMAMAEGKTMDQVPAPFNSVETSTTKVTVTDGKPETIPTIAIP
jgi:hypothetical protein